MRQLTDEVGDLSLVKSYLPYGEAITGAGGAASAYGYTGEWVDELTNLVFLRARWYAPQSGRFTTQDAWQGDIKTHYRSTNGYTVMPIRSMLAIQAEGTHAHYPGHVGQM